MKFKIKKLNSAGFSHDIVLVLVVSLFSIGGAFYLVASHADPIKSSTISATSPNLKHTYYTKIGTIPARDLYDVKVPPPAGDMPAMSIYACEINSGNGQYMLSYFAELGKAVPSSISGNWYDDLDLSSSASSNNITGVSAKGPLLSFTNNTWVSNARGDSVQSIPVTTPLFDDGAITNDYVWASGSYGGTVINTINNHPDASTLDPCLKS